MNSASILVVDDEPQIPACVALHAGVSSTSCGGGERRRGGGTGAKGEPDLILLM